MEVELGFDLKQALSEAKRCLIWDVQTVFESNLCIECDACVEVCPVHCITFTRNGEETQIRTRLTAPSLDPEQSLYVGEGLESGLIRVKDENLCLHCGLCADRCPTDAWDMRKYLINISHAGCNARA